VSRSGGDCLDWQLTAIPPTATTQTGVLLNGHASSQIDRRLGSEGTVALPASQCVLFGVVHVQHLLPMWVQDGIDKLHQIPMV